MESNLVFDMLKKFTASVISKHKYLFRILDTNTNLIINSHKIKIVKKKSNFVGPSFI